MPFLFPADNLVFLLHPCLDSVLFHHVTGINPLFISHCLPLFPLTFQPFDFFNAFLHSLLSLGSCHRNISLFSAHIDNNWLFGLWENSHPGEPPCLISKWQANPLCVEKCPKGCVCPHMPFLLMASLVH